MKVIGQIIIVLGFFVLLNAIYVLMFKYDLAGTNLSAPQMTQLYSESIANALIAIGLMQFGYLVLVVRHENEKK